MLGLQWWHTPSIIWNSGFGFQVKRPYPKARYVQVVMPGTYEGRCMSHYTCNQLGWSHTGLGWTLTYIPWCISIEEGHVNSQTLRRRRKKGRRPWRQAEECQGFPTTTRSWKMGGGSLQSFHKEPTLQTPLFWTATVQSYERIPVAINGSVCGVLLEQPRV
jgi:hypothetical protein